MDKTSVSKTSPKTNNRACLCKDGTYSKDCCTGEMIAQGIGSFVNQTESTTTKTTQTRNINVNRD